MSTALIKESIDEMKIEDLESKTTVAVNKPRDLTKVLIKSIVKDLATSKDCLLTIARKHGVQRAQVYMIESERKAALVKASAEKEIEPEPIE